MATPAAAEHDDFVEWKKWVERSIREALARGATRPQLNLTDGDFLINGGSMTIEGDGGIAMKSAEGVEIFSAFGRSSEPEPDGTPQPQVRMYRADGTPAFYLWDPLPLQDGYQQFFAWYDRFGNIIFGDDTTSGRGLARPYMRFQVLDENGTDYVTPASTASFLDVHTIAGYIQNPRLEVAVSATAPATGAGEVQIIKDGTGEILAGPTSIPAGTTVAPFYEFNVPGNLDMWSYQYFNVQTRRVSGTGNIQSRVWSASGVQS